MCTYTKDIYWYDMGTILITSKQSTNLHIHVRNNYSKLKEQHRWEASVTDSNGYRACKPYTLFLWECLKFEWTRTQPINCKANQVWANQRKLNELWEETGSLTSTHSLTAGYQGSGLHHNEDITPNRRKLYWVYIYIIYISILNTDQGGYDIHC